MGRYFRIPVPTDCILPFATPVACVMFCEDWLKNTTVAVLTDTQKERERQKHANWSYYLSSAMVQQWDWSKVAAYLSPSV